MLSSDGKVAEQGSYRALSNNPNGAFTKLMEWQMSGGETTNKSDSTLGIAAEPRGPPSDLEDIMAGANEEEDVEGVEVDEEGIKVRKDEETKAEAVLEKIEKGNH